MKVYHERIPVRPHIFKYLSIEFPEPYKVSESDIIGPMLIQFMRRPENSTQSLSSVDKLTNHWSIEIPEHCLIDRGSYNFGSRNILTFNTYIDQLMKEILYRQVQVYVQHEKQQKQAILDFMLEYGISENDLSFDGWKKSMQRLEKKKVKKIV